VKQNWVTVKKNSPACELALVIGPGLGVLLAEPALLDDVLLEQRHE
jgi:hypothetical protein